MRPDAWARPCAGRARIVRWRPDEGKADRVRLVVAAPGRLLMGRSERQQIGDAGEQQALDHLLAAGLALVARQASNRLGEIDLIMRQGDELVFVEVRRRRRSDYGSAADTVTSAKQRRVLRAAQAWLQNHCGDRWPACRFDVVAIDGHSIEWIRGAFCL